MRRRNAIPRNQLEAQDRELALATLALMRREGYALRVAAKAKGISPKKIVRYVGSALRQKGGRYRSAPYDRIPRLLDHLTRMGSVPVTVRDSRTASRIGEHRNAVKVYRNSGDSSALKKFKGKSFRASGVKYEFVTDTAVLDELANALELPSEGLYRTATGP